METALLEFATVPMEKFRLKWRFTDPQYHLLPAIHLAQVKPLSVADAKRLWDLISDAGIHLDDPFTAGLFHSVVETSVGDTSGEDVEEDRRVRKWLYQRGLPFRRRIWLSYQPDTAIETTWKILVKYWTAFYYPGSDDLTVVDGTLNWALLFHHEERIFFGSNIVGSRDRAT